MLMWIFMGSAVVSILLAMLIVSISTHNQRGILLPTTPDTTGPVWIPTLPTTRLDYFHFPYRTDVFARSLNLNSPLTWAGAGWWITRSPPSGPAPLSRSPPRACSRSSPATRWPPCSCRWWSPPSRYMSRYLLNYLPIQRPPCRRRSDLSWHWRACRGSWGGWQPPWGCSRSRCAGTPQCLTEVVKLQF